MSGYIAIVVALIGVAGGIWMQIIQFKKDAQRIEEVNKTANLVHCDTAEIKPKVDNIETNTNVIRDDITRIILPKVDGIQAIGNSVNELLEEKRINDAIKQRVSTVVDNPGYIISAIDSIYEKNAFLQEENSNLKNDIKIQAMENITLRKENENLKQELEALKHDKGQLQRNSNRDEREL